MTETTKRILELQKQKGIKNYPLEKAAGLPVSTIQYWVNGKKKKDGGITPASPSAEAITKLARYFNVTSDYLLCLTDDPKPLKTKDIVERHDFSLYFELENLSKDKDFINSAKLYNAVSDEYKKQICAYILGIATALGVNIAQVLGK